MDKIDKLKSLQQEISKHNIKYHQQDSPEISDAKFDRLKQELEKLEQELNIPEFIEIGAKPLEGFIKSEHKKPMFSFQFLERFLLLFFRYALLFALRSRFTIRR